MSKEIPLTKGKIAIVDDDDYELLAHWKWYYSQNSNGRGGYAARRDSARQMIRMHRLILNAPEGIEVDHVNGNPLDNRRDNLRLCSRAENCRNIAKCHRQTTSCFRGVYRTLRGQWAAMTGVNGKRVWIGRFDSEEEAARAYDRAILVLHGSFARVNG
jgi:hypothetical protein